MFVPETSALVEHGQAGSLLDDLKGAGKQLFNSLAGLANAMIAGSSPLGAASYLATGKGEFSLFDISSRQLAGASAMELGSYFLGTGELKLLERVSEPSICVIGRLHDTEIARDGPGHIVQNIPISEWSFPKNDAWVQKIIDTRSRVYIASPLTPENMWDMVNNRPRVTTREMSQLFDAGYTKQGDYLHPPKN